ncbi:MAG: SPASM domain-containing protein [Thalassovita sp.]
MDSPDAIAVDLRGNVMTCQNTGAKGAHKIGHVAEFGAMRSIPRLHFAFREECMSCPVVQLCKGSCMFLVGEFFKQSCANEFAFNMGIMMAAVWHLTGMVVVGVNAIDNENWLLFAKCSFGGGGAFISPEQVRLTRSTPAQ